MTTEAVDLNATIEELQERAARAAAELADVHAEQERRAMAEAERLAQHRSAVDAETIATYDRKALDADVDKAKAALEKEIAANPLTRAMSAFYVAQAKRRRAFDEFVSAQARQGIDTSGVQYPQIVPYDPIELMTRLAEQAGSDARVEAETRLVRPLRQPR